MYSHFIFTRKKNCIWIFFSRENEIVDIFQAYIGNKTNCDGPTAVVPHYIWKLSVSIFLSFWPTSNVLKFVFSRKIVAHFCVAWKNLNFIHLLLIFTVWVSMVKWKYLHCFIHLFEFLLVFSKFSDLYRNVKARQFTLRENV